MKKIASVMCLFMAIYFSVSAEGKKEFDQQWKNIEPDIFELNTKYDIAFYTTITYLSQKWLPGNKFHYHSTNVNKSEAFTSESEANVLIEGNCTSKIILNDGGVIYIKGDLIGSIEIKGHGEIIIAGSIKKGSKINTNGIVRMFIGGDMDGIIHNLGSSKCFIKQNFNGVLTTGTPSTFLYVYGNYNGKITYSGSEGHLLYIIVEGFMPFQKIQSVLNMKYTQVRAFINKSNATSKILQDTQKNKRQTWYIKIPNQKNN